MICENSFLPCCTATTTEQELMAMACIWSFRHLYGLQTWAAMISRYNWAKSSKWCVAHIIFPLYHRTQRIKMDPFAYPHASPALYKKCQPPAFFNICNEASKLRKVVIFFSPSWIFPHQSILIICRTVWSIVFKIFGKLLCSLESLFRYAKITNLLHATESPYFCCNSPPPPLPQLEPTNKKMSAKILCCRTWSPGPEP